MNNQRQKSRPADHVFEWVAPFSVRYPLISQTGLVPLRPLAQTLGVSFQSLVSAAGRLPIAIKQEWVIRACESGAERPQITLSVPAEWLAFLLIAATPRKTSQRFHALRGQAQALAMAHPPQSAPVAHQAVARAAVLQHELKVTKEALEALRRSSAAVNGKRYIERRWSPGSQMTEETMLKISELAGKGVPLKTIGREVGKNFSTISQFLAGKYSSAAARDYYKKHGVPGKTGGTDAEAIEETITECPAKAF